MSEAELKNKKAAMIVAAQRTVLYLFLLINQIKPVKQ